MFLKTHNLFDFAKGGVYCIKCLQNNKVYIGSSASFLERSARHWTLLKAQTHECLELQQDFKKYGNAFFEFTILVFENHLQKRLQLEKQLIAQQPPNKLYNVLPSSRFEKKRPVLGQQILMDKKSYSTIREAERATKISKATIMRRLNNSEDLICSRLSKKPVSLGKYNFIVNEVRYSSTQEVVANNLARSDNQVRERCRSKSLKWKHWQMVQKHRSNDYPDRE
uniref:Putative site-specific DNA endonuclease n=1 Tax=Tupiella akineta TaxID=160070 RepID=Q3ZJ31_TUPAK|nr:putative site-specific DNA endonuclease [Tupiella akineta]AAV80658.1 putative site-specific DNA endonuclease [Tupiella akineta]